jgi:GNAT superfamily N-acetyltransferase
MRASLFRRRQTMPIRPCTSSDLDEMFAVINDAAIAYRGVIPSDRWKEPYMPMEELREEITAGVAFWGLFEAEGLEAVMGLQRVKDVALVRHAYTRTASQGRGHGKALLRHVLAQTDTAVLIGTWQAAKWAIGFYQGQGYALVDPATKERLLHEYWSVPARQVEESVVLADAKWRATSGGTVAVDIVRMKRTAEDFDFALAAKREALGPHIADRWGWDEAAQRAQQAESWHSLSFSRIVHDGEPVGALSVEYAADYLKLIGLYIFPRFQRKGIGGEVLRRVASEARARNVPLRLRCLKWNPALSLYERHGFVVRGETDTHFEMEKDA